MLDRARARKRLKRGGGRSRAALDLDEALGRLAQIDARCAQLVKLRLFAGLSLDDAADALGVARRTAERDWAFARAWLFRQLAPRDAF